MSFKVRNVDNTTYIEPASTDFVLRNEQDMLDLISACYEYDTNKILIAEENLPSEFFDLKSNLAGMIFQKFANYHLRGAGIISLAEIKSERFKELVMESNKGTLFRFFEDRETAEKWLASE